MIWEHPADVTSRRVPGVARTGKRANLWGMWTDVVDLREFYGGRLGRAAQRTVRRRVRDMWSDVSGLRVLGLGFATPYLGIFRGEAERVLAAMPAAQGVLHWPQGERGLTTLVDEADLPLPDLSIDRVLLIHSLEYTERVRPMLREVWRVMADSGRLIVVVPNRRGLWARFETLPHGMGRPYSAGQLTRLLRDNMFMPMNTERALFMPPFNASLVTGAAAPLEKIGRRVFPAAGGVVVCEATKQMYAQTVAAEPVRKRAFKAVTGRPQGLNRDRDGCR